MPRRATLLYVRTISALRRRPVREEGAGMVEYALLIALIAMAAIAAVTLLGTTLAAEYESIASSVADA